MSENEALYDLIEKYRDGCGGNPAQMDRIATDFRKVAEASGAPVTYLEGYMDAVDVIQEMARAEEVTSADHVIRQAGCFAVAVFDEMMNREEE